MYSTTTEVGAKVVTIKKINDWQTDSTMVNNFLLIGFEKYLSWSAMAASHRATEKVGIVFDRRMVKD